MSKRNPLELYDKYIQNTLEENEQQQCQEDLNFLNLLDHYSVKMVNIKLTAFSNINPEAIPPTIIGRVTGGSINIDGSSAIRRSCNLSLVVLETDKEIQEEYWAYNTEIKIEIGLNNLINPTTYDDIIWFNMGRFVITSFNISKSTTSTNVSISGKDKMCRLNGEISGHLPIQTNFGEVDVEQKDGTIKIEKVLIKDIIQQAVHNYALEPIDNIIINDLDLIDGYELWEYRGDKPLYYFIKIKDTNSTDTSAKNTKIVNISLDDQIKIKTSENGTPFPIRDFKGKFYSYNTMDPAYNNDATKIGFSKDSACTYYLAKIEYGETGGYHKTPLVYNSDLILNVGETITSLLDKIKSMLGEFEYFYDTEGKFIFQQKRNYKYQLVPSPFQEESQKGTAQNLNYAYKFEDFKLITSIGRSPNVANVKNDFSIWGIRQSVSGADLPIHMRYAIHYKPKSYISYSGVEYSTSSYDWRELIYQMAKDNDTYGNEKDYLDKLKNNNYVKEGKTGYEQYYMDLLGFWRQLYDPENHNDEFYTSEASSNMKYWNKKFYNDPGSLNFWMDFLDPTEDVKKEILDNYSITKIKSRTKSLNDSQVKGMYYKDTPELLFILPGETLSGNFTPLQVQENTKELFTRSAQGVSVIDKANEIVNTNVASAEGLNITAIPIYYLQPNTRIYVKGYGDYTLDKLTFNLSYNGTMSLTCNKIIEDLV